MQVIPIINLLFLEKFGVPMPRGCNEEAVIYDEVFASRVPIRQPFPMDQ
jgi:hypothetical protein